MGYYIAKKRIEDNIYHVDTTWKYPSRAPEVVRVKTLPPTSKAGRVSGFTVAWLAWGLFFIVVEGIALFRKGKNDTFSEHWWSLFRLGKRVPLVLKLWLLAIQLTFGTWLVGHLAFGWWTL